MKKILDQIDIGISELLLIVMTSLAFANVLSRYVIHASISFTDELTSSLFVLFSLLGASVAVRNRSHLGLTVLTDLFPPKLRLYTMSAGYALGGLFCVLGAYTGFFMALHQYTIGQVTPSLMLPEWIYGSFVPIGMGIMCIRFFICAYETIKEKEPTEAKGGRI